MSVQLRHYINDLLRSVETFDQDGKAVRITDRHVKLAAESLAAQIRDGNAPPVVFATPDHPDEFRLSGPADDLPAPIARDAWGNDPRFVGPLTGVRLSSDGWLQSEFDAGDKNIPRTIGASAWLVENLRIGDKVYPLGSEHVALLADPAVPGQRPMLRLRLGNQRIETQITQMNAETSAGAEPAQPKEEFVMSKLIEQIRLRLKLDEKATDDQVLAALDAATKPPEAKPDTIAAKLRSALGVAADADEAATFAALEKRLNASTPQPLNASTPAETAAEKEMKLRLAAAEDRISGMDREVFAREMDDLARPLGECPVGFITPAMRDRAVRDFDRLHSVKLRSGDGKSDVRGDDGLVAILKELKNHPLLQSAAGKLRIVPGLPSGDKVDAKAEAAKTMAAAGIETKAG